MRRRFFFLFLLVLPASLGWFFAGEAGATMRITAKELSAKGDVYTFRGSVQIQKDQITAGADEAVYDQATGDLHLIGNTYYENPDAILTGDEAIYNLNQKTGAISNGTIFYKKRNFYVRSRDIERTGENLYQFRKATFTACDEETPAWSITGSDIKVNTEDKVYIKNSTFRIKKVPVLYAPAFWLPAKNKRESGFLPPTFGYGSFGGAHFVLPYYWAFSRHRDATIDLDYYSKRAFGAAVNARYLEQGGFSGEQSLGYLRDWADRVDYMTFNGSHRAPFGFLNLDLLNHRDFYRLYSLRYQIRARRYLESSGEASVTYPGEAKLFIDTRWFQDLEDGVDQKSVVQRLPEIGFYAYPREIGSFAGSPFVFGMTTSAVNFWREHGQSAGRFNLAPRVSWTIGDGIDLFQSAGAGLRAYDFNRPGEKITQAVVDYEASLRARYQKTYGSMTHYLEPVISYSYRSLTDGSTPVVFDELEMEGKTSVFEAAIWNRLYDLQGQFFVSKLSEQYDLNDPVHPLKPITLSAASSRPVALSAVVTYEPYSRSFDTIDVDSSFSIQPLDTQITARERFARSENTWLHSLGAIVKASPKVSVETNIWYDTKGGGLRQLDTAVHYTSQCWGITVMLSKKPGNTAVYFRVQLRGIG
ncbi:MAG: LPS assembly protein LptD [Nitrospiraceae bacterium]|nr:LPS assembly protein LptD [Nitrospiraceae bacterium]